MKKTKLFLGAYINSTNAQNLNCRALAKHFDKDKFEIYTLELYSGSLEKMRGQRIHIFKCFKPHRISKYLGYLWGIYHCDVAYLPKEEIFGWNKFLLKLFGKKSFRTVEVIYKDEVVKPIVAKTSYQEFLQRFQGFDRIYSITKFLRDYNFHHHRIDSEEKVLYLGTEIQTFLNENKRTTELKNIVLIGNDLVRKGIADYIELAKRFPSITFHVVGSGNGKIDMDEEIKKHALLNVVYHNTLSHDRLKNLLNDIDLHILPSRSEGFPKVTLETAAAGVPSLLYNDYGAGEWIIHEKNGFIVGTLDEMADTIKKLSKNPELIQNASKNAIEMAKRFDWKEVISVWEKVVEEMAGTNSR